MKKWAIILIKNNKEYGNVNGEQKKIIQPIDEYTNTDEGQRQMHPVIAQKTKIEIVKSYDHSPGGIDRNSNNDIKPVFGSKFCSTN